jgi:hypothetical protein
MRALDEIQAETGEVLDGARADLDVFRADYLEPRVAELGEAERASVGLDDWS